MLVDETPQRNQNRSRNIGFELSIAAAAARCQLPISFDGPGDLSVLPNGDSIAVECKRPFTARKIEARVSEGLKQLVERYESGCSPQHARGILAVSITKTENDGSKQLRSLDETTARAQIDGIFHTFVARHSRHWKSRTDGRTLAVLLELCAPCRVEKPSILAVAREYAWIPLCVRDSQDRVRFENVALAFNRMKTLITPAE